MRDARAGRTNLFVWEEPSVDDATLAARAPGDREAFAELYRRHVRMVTGFVAQRVDDPDELADVVSTVWVNVLHSIRRYDPARAKFTSWLLGVTAKTVAEGRRREARRWNAHRHLDGRREVSPDAREDLEAAIHAEQTLPAVRAAMARLTAQERQALDLIAADVSYEEAAALLHVTPASLRMRVHRARARLHQLLDEPLTSSPSAALEGDRP